MVELAEIPQTISAAGDSAQAMARARLRMAGVCIVGVALGAAILPYCAVGAALGPMMLEFGWGANQVSLAYALLLWAGGLSVVSGPPPAIDHSASSTRAFLIVERINSAAPPWPVNPSRRAAYPIAAQGHGSPKDPADHTMAQGELLNLMTFWRCAEAPSPAPV